MKPEKYQQSIVTLKYVGNPDHRWDINCQYTKFRFSIPNRNILFARTLVIVRCTYFDFDNGINHHIVVDQRHYFIRYIFYAYLG